MSTFKVSTETISSVVKHPGADRLEIAMLDGMAFQFIVPTGEYKQGDVVVYFPIDSVLPEPIIEKLGLIGKLAGGAKNRIRTVRLRGIISQGIVAKQETFWADVKFATDCDITTLLGVEKYDPDLLVVGMGKGNMPSYLKALPSLVSIYDIEGADRHKNIADKYLMDQQVMITEKIEGSHFAVSLDAEDNFTVCQRRHRIDDNEVDKLESEHAWLKMSKRYDFKNILKDMRAHIAKVTGDQVQVLTVRGELIGERIQGNYYGIVGHQVFVFEIEVNGKAVSALMFYSLAQVFGLNTVPILAFGKTLKSELDGITIQSYSDGTSMLHPTKLREGIVIRPVNEVYDERFGRVILKQRSREYLAREA